MPRLALVSLLFASCVATSAPPLHHPDLSISELAKTGEANSSVFKSYNLAGPVRWNQGWPWKFDLTGIGWDARTTVTAITSRHVVMANHFQRKAGNAVVFHDRDGRPHRREILKVIPTSEAGLPSDIAVGLLDQPLPKSIRTYPLLSVNTDDAARLVGACALITEQDRRLFFHQIQGVTETIIRFQFDPRLDESKRKRLITGDSGNPSFILSKGELALIETHSGGGPGSGPFYGNAKVIGAIKKIVSDLDSTYQIRTVGVDKKVLKDAEVGRASMPKPTTPTSRSVSPHSTHPNVPSRRPRPRVVVPANP